METAYRLVREQLKTAAERRKHTYDIRVRTAEFSPGNLVWYYSPRRFRGRSPKWERTCTGPFLFLVMEQMGPVNYRLRKTANSRPFVAHVDKLRLCVGGKPEEQEEEPRPPPGETSTTDAGPKRTIRRPVRFQ